MGRLTRPSTKLQTILQSGFLWDDFESHSGHIIRLLSFGKCEGLMLNISIWKDVLMVLNQQ
jgi:hypothetical protein